MAGIWNMHDDKKPGRLKQKLEEEAARCEQKKSILLKTSMITRRMQ